MPAGSPQIQQATERQRQEDAASHLPSQKLSAEAPPATEPAVRNQRKLFLFFSLPPSPLSLSLSLSMSLYLPPLSLSPSSGLRTAVLRQTYWQTALWEVSILLFWLLGEQRVTERKREREVGHELKHSLVLQLKSESSRTERAGLTSSGRSGAAQHTVT